MPGAHVDYDEVLGKNLRYWRHRLRLGVHAFSACAGPSWRTITLTRPSPRILRSGLRMHCEAWKDFPPQDSAVSIRFRSLQIGLRGPFLRHLFNTRYSSFRRQYWMLRQINIERSILEKTDCGTSMKTPA